MQFWKELLISATSGLFGRLLLVLIGAGGGFNNWRGCYLW